jgi:hypothetical protein
MFDLLPRHELRVARARVEQDVAHHAADLTLEPTVDRPAEKPHLRPVDDVVRNAPARDRTEDVLCLVPAQLEPRRHARAELDDPMIEVRDAHLQRMGHRRPIDVMEHVVGEAELGVEHESALHPSARRAVESLVDRLLQNVGHVSQRVLCRAHPRTLDPLRAQRQAGRNGVGGGGHRSRAAQPRWTAPADQCGRPSQGHRCRADPVDQGDVSISLVAGEQLVGTLSGERDSHVLCSQGGERTEADG